MGIDVSRIGIGGASAGGGLAAGPALLARDRREYALDGFADEDIAYAVRLRHAGVPVELHVYPGAPHGLDLSADAGITRRANHDLEEWLRPRLG